MPYIINKTNGEPLLTLEDGTLNDDYSVGLLGKNTIGYGEVQNENFIQLLENFAGIAPPSGNILTGQVYYNIENKQINVYDGSQWKIVGDAVVHPKDPTLPIADQGLGITAPSRGTLWLNSTTQQLFVYNSGWKLIGPEAVENFGTTRAVTTVLIDTVGTAHPVIQVTINNTVIAICSASLFTIASSNAVNGFSILKPGITLSATADIKGSLDGNALTATRLQNLRLINGQPFDGSSDITITALTSTTLTRGEYLLGDNFNGSAPTTWSVDATVESNPLKIVVRNALGDFSARNITANLIGNVTGNVTVLTGTSQFNNIVANSFEGNVTGNLIGLASSTLKLENSRSINGVSFNGTTNINITAPTPNPLVPGQYVQGDSFDGSISRSWNVLATPNNDAEKIVARDSQGNFVAGTITANIVGNVTGNVTSTGVSNFNILNASQLSGTLTGNASGNAGSATRLQTPRAINGVAFDGTSPITVKSSTTATLRKGSYVNFTTSSGLLTVQADAAGSTASSFSVLAQDRNYTGWIVIKSDPQSEIDDRVIVRENGNYVASSTLESSTSIISNGIEYRRDVTRYTGYKAAFYYLRLESNVFNTSDLDFLNKFQQNQVTGWVEISPAWNEGGPLQGLRTVVGYDIGPGAGDFVSSSTSVIGLYETLLGQNNLTIQKDGFVLPDRSTQITVNGNTYELKCWRFNTLDGIPFDVEIYNYQKTNTLNFSTFDGTFDTEVSVNATSNNTSDSIVARNSNGDFSARTITANLIGNVTGNLTGNVTGNLTGNTTGTHNGSVVGNVTGNVTGSASNNLLKAGDTMTGDINWTATGQGINWAFNTDGASIRFYNTGDNDTNSRLEFETRDNNNEYFRWSHTPSGGTNYESMRLVTNGPDNAALTVRGSINAIGNVSASSLSGNGSSITNLNASQLTSGTVDSSRLAGTYSINISGSAANNVSKTGDIMTGYLTLIGSPVNANHAATKAYVDATTAYTITYGTNESTSGFTNQVGSFNNNRNYFDVFPPAGRTMGNLEAFIPSIAVIHYAGGVNGDDSMRCVWSNLGDRIRVWVQNTEQRSTPAANWLAIWR